MTLTPYLYTRQRIGAPSGEFVTGIGIQEDGGYLWVEDRDGRLTPYSTGKMWQLAPLPSDAAMVAPLLTRVRDYLHWRAEASAKHREDQELVLAAAERADQERQARRAAITVGDYIVVSSTTLARVASRDAKRIRIERYIPHIDHWGPVQTLASSWSWEIATPEEIVAHFGYLELAEARAREEADVARRMIALREEATRDLKTRAEWREEGYRVRIGSAPQYRERYLVPGYSTVYRDRHYFSRGQVVPLRATVAAALTQIRGVL
jgi:hypothetical protein